MYLSNLSFIVFFNEKKKRVVLLGKAFKGISPSQCDMQVEACLLSKQDSSN